MSAEIHLEDLNAAQRAAVEYEDAPLLILAGAGSGKTRVITRRIAHLIDRGRAEPGECLAVTFTNKAAREMKERVEALVGSRASEVTASTFHSSCARWLRRYGRSMGLGPSFSIYDMDDQRQALKAVAQELGRAYDRSAVKAWARRIDGITNNAMSVHEVETQARGAEQERFAELYAAYVHHLRRANACDFGHLISFMVQLLESNEAARSTFRHRYTHIFVDEFQDTNVAQYRLLRALAPSNGAVTIVGDDDQSIYGWRGASVGNMQRFIDDYENVQVVKLEENYRSSQPILNLANEVIAPLPDRMEKRLFTTRAHGASPRVFIASDEREEAEFTARTIAEIQQAGRYRLDEIAIFYRTNAQSRSFEEALRHARIAHELVGSVGFFDRREVKDVVAWLRVAANPADDVAFLRIINTPPRGIGSVTIDEFLGHRAHAADNVDALRALIANLPSRINARTVDGLGELLEIVEQLVERAPSERPASLIDFVLRRTGYLEWLQQQDPDTFDERDRNVSELVNVATERSLRAEDAELADATPVSHFLASITLETSQDALDTVDDGAVRLMTIHTAKGLEFPVVFVTGLEEGLIPMERRDEPLLDEAIAEERRLCYVAFTRAEDELWLTMAQQRRSRGRTLTTEPSRFVRDLDAALFTIDAASNASSFDWRPSYARTGSSGRRGSAPVTWDEFDQRPSWERDVWGDAEVPDEGVLFDDSYFPASSVASANEYVGRQAEHKLFGIGEIVAADPTGDKVRLTIRFPEVGTKKVILKYVNLL